jgi:cell division protein FtsQ
MKAILLIVTVAIFIFIALKLFQPKILDKFYNKASSYFFYYLSLDNHEFNQINISGNQRVSKDEIIAIVNSVKKDFSHEEEFKYQTSIQNLIDEIRSNLRWIKEVTISRSLPNILNITIVEYEPFAIWQSSDKKYIIDRDGNTIPFEDLEEVEKMVILSGNGANIHARSLFNIFAIDSTLSQNVYSATWVGNRRWNIRFENGLLIKLPENDIAQGWQNLIKIYEMPGSIIGLKVIDLRIKDKIYLEYENSVMKEIQKI